MLLFSAIHRSPPSVDTYTPMSVPANSTVAFSVSSRIEFTGHSGRLLEMFCQVAPKSVVLNTNGLKLSVRRPVLVMYAVPGANRDAYTRLTHISSAAPAAV